MIPAGFHEINIHTTLARHFINVAINVPENPIATVQIIHGMSEHKERYYPFIDFLVKKGFAVIIADNRGHGKSIDKPEDLGYTSWHELYNYNSDLGNTLIARTFRDIPHFIIAHSLGSLIAITTLQHFDDRIDGLFLLGNPSYSPLVKIAGEITSELSEKLTPRYRSEKIQNMFESFLNRNFEDVPHSWICSNPEVVMAFNNDPLCNFTYTLSGFGSLVALMKRAYNVEIWKHCINKNPDLPIRFISGKDDPCMFSEKRFFQSVDFLRDKGYRNISHKLYTGMRHEVLNETDKMLVWNDIANHLVAWSENKRKSITAKYTFNSLSEKLPIVNGILYPDGKFQKASIITDENWKRNIRQTQIKAKFLFSESNVYTDTIIQSEIICDDLGCRVVCGEGSYGGDGFVLVENIQTKKLLWLASFDNSNPFVSIQRDEKGFIVTNNCNEKWIFDISDIDNIKISII